MQTNQLEAKMLKQIGVSLQSLEWFILQGFIKSLVEDPEKVKLLFATQEDCAAIEAILTKIQRQFAPHIAKEIEAESIEAKLSIAPKKLHTPSKTLLV